LTVPDNPMVGWGMSIPKVPGEAACYHRCIC
jgi:hypothetical protein